MTYQPLAALRCVCGHRWDGHTSFDGLSVRCLNCQCRTYTTTARQAAGQPAADPTIADDPVPLRWGLNDVLYGDDDTITVCFSGPDREPYWLELDPDQAAVLRDDLTPPAAGLAAPTNHNTDRRREITPRERLEIMIRTNRHSMTVWSPPEVRDALDAYRAAILNSAADTVWALADRTSEAGLGALGVVDRLRRLAAGAES